MRKALIVGIDNYPTAPLKGCENDANKINDLLEEHYDGKRNFHTKLLVSSRDRITRVKLMTEIIELFRFETEIALLYFSGHGAGNNLGGFLVTQDAEKNDLGVSLNDIISIANKSLAKEVVIILDSCHSGHAGNNTGLFDNNVAILRKGISILTSSERDQLSVEKNSAGLFTSIVCNALSGFASDLLGNITIASIYNYADKLLGPWDQRPIFKTHISNIVSLRRCKPWIEPQILRKIKTYFKHQDYKYSLSPAFDPELEPRDEEKEAIFKDLQKFTSLSLVKPNNADHMYFAAINSESCSLTQQGKAYREIVVRNML